MKKFLSRLPAAFMIFMALNCDNSPHPGNPLLGKWKSLWPGGQNKSIDFSISFESNNTFHVTAFGVGQTQQQRIFGIYRINGDTMMLKDTLDEPAHLCNYTDSGKYTFTKHNDTLLFKVIKDGCERRKLTFEMGLKQAR